MALATLQGLRIYTRLVAVILGIRVWAPAGRQAPAGCFPQSPPNSRHCDPELRLLVMMGKCYYPRNLLWSSGL